MPTPLPEAPLAASKTTFRRYECKYAIDEAQAAAVRQAIGPYVEPDPHARKRPDGCYDIQSAYLDSPNLRLYQETRDGNVNRLKLRVREYPGSGADAPVFAEIKRRYDRLVLKSRARMSRPMAVDMLAGVTDKIPGLSQDEQACHDEFVGWLLKWQARPVVWVGYTREAYVGIYQEDLRITFDRRLRCAPAESLERPEETDWREMEPCRVVLELKFDVSYPDWMQQLVARHELRQESFSKYAKAVERGLDHWRLPSGFVFGSDG
jgi:SPX domain protein involved in polyphosphate accumulation